jgi:vacuolar iron transporter family protein
MKTAKNQVLETYISEFVYGAIDGTVTTFAVVAAAAGAGLSVSIALVMGLANLFADGFSMGVSAYLGKKSGKDQINKLRNNFYKRLHNEAHLNNYLRKHMQEGYGFSGNQLEQAVDIAMKEPDRVRAHLEQDLFGTIDSDENPLHLGLATFIAFILLGSVPLFAYLFAILDGNATNITIFAITCFLTLIAFSFIGLAKGIVTHTNRLEAVVETVFLGGSAAAIAFMVGSALESII